MRQQKCSNAYLDQQIRKLRREIEELNMSTEISWDTIYYTRKRTAEVLGIHSALLSVGTHEATSNEHSSEVAFSTPSVRCFV